MAAPVLIANQAHLGIPTETLLSVDVRWRAPEQIFLKVESIRLEAP
ncbi:MAG: hypothetical protein HY816_10435 [Candidatus Wallbacteria bacterium]|nr:hypothetical protein [Candidatus Wallbacteria bacterium]